MEKDLNYYLELKYPFKVEQSKDGTYYLEYIDLPGCMTCAATLDEVVKMGEDAKISWLEIALEDGMKIPEPRELEDYSGELRVRFPKTLHRDLVQQAAKENISLNQYCVYLLTKQHENHIR